jgi:DNA-binding transcriptional LysR family regulator
LARKLGEPWVLSPYESFIGSRVKEAFRAKGLAPPPLTVISTSIQLYTALMATGRFLALRPASILALSGKRMSEKAVAVDLPIRPVHTAIVTLKNRTISPVARLFIECTRKVARPFVKGSPL